MFSLFDSPVKLCDGITRREMLRVGGVGALGAGFTLADLLQAKASESTRSADSVFGRAKNVIYLWLQGGPPQHETWDPKPDAPEEIRGEFKPIATNVPGIYLSELLPRTAALADKLAIVRSISTDIHEHSASGYHILTGYRYLGGNSRRISPDDWPYLGSVLRMVKPSATMPAYTSVWLPDIMRLNENVTPAGQTAGFLGRRWDPERIIWDPSNPQSHMQRLTPATEVPPLRMNMRQGLLGQVDQHFRRLENNRVLDTYGEHTRDAFAIIGSGRARRAFDIGQEPAHVRERYGRTKWGQCVLLARRLVEAGVRLVHVNWTREDGDSAVDNPMWDTHALNSDRLQDALCPTFDIGFSALIEDLQQRGLLEETLVVVIGEFGRTPRINQHAGRDHWGSVFSFALAGAGIRTAQVFGASDRIGAYPRDNPVKPEDLTASILHLLGVDHHAMFNDRANRPMHITRGTPLYRLLGSEPASEQRQRPEGDVALVPPFNDERLCNTHFADGTPLIEAGARSRVKGWRAAPVLAADVNGFGARLLAGTADQHRAALGVWSAGTVAQGAKALLAQEIRLARAGRYRVTMRAAGTATSRRDFEELFVPHFTCRLVLFRFTEATKDPRRIQELASMSFVPVFQDRATNEYSAIEMRQLLDSPAPGANFSIGLGLGVAVIVQKTSPGDLHLPAGREAFLDIDSLAVDFGGRQINEAVDF